jgi:hypothetical protein
MVLPHVISQREDSAPWTTTICQTMHRVAIAPITDHTPTKNARNVRCDITGRPARCWMWCAGSHDLKSPLRTRASHRFHHNLNLSPQRTSPPGCAGVAPACRVHRHCARIQRYTPSPLHRLGARASRPHAGCTGIAPAYSDTPHHPCTAWVRGRRARMRRYTPSPLHRLGARASSPHAGCTGIAPACRVHRHCARIRRTLHHLCTAWVRGRRARIRRYTPSPLHRLGARASRPHAGCTGIAPVYGDTLHHPCTAWVRGLPARMPGAQALRPYTAIHSITPAPPGCAGFQPACRVYRHCARIQQYTPSPLHRLGARASSPHAGCAGVVPACRVRRRRACTQRCNPSEGGTPSSRSACVPPGVNSYTTCPIVSLPGSCYTAIRSWAEACPLLSERP